MQTKTNYRSKSFISLSLSTALLTVGLIVFGAVVRVTDSGLGCGNEWPLCNGTIFPPLDNITAWIEWTHRLFALLIGIFGLITLGVAIRNYRNRDSRVLVATVVAAGLFALQSALGAMVVVLDLPPTFVTLHLGVAMLLLAALIIAAVLAWYKPTTGYQADSITSLTYMNAGFALLIILTGALVRGSGATLACTEWPLCNNGSLLPFEQGQLAVIHMIHRFAVVALGITILILIWQVMNTRSESITRQVAIGVGVLYLLQVGVGAMFVLSIAGPEWGAAHVGLAASTWGLLVVLAVIETMNNQQVATSRLET
jgi:heme A synthase